MSGSNNNMLTPNTNMESYNFNFEPRSSTETDRRYLLADSIAPSESASMIHYGGDDGDRTPRAHSPEPTEGSEQQQQQAQSGSADADGRARIPAGAQFERRDTIATPAPQPYRGFPSEAHYLAALRDWAESKKYIDGNAHTLVGFYGEKTMDEYVTRPPLEGFGLRKKWKARREARRESKAKIPTVAADSSDRPVAASRRNTVT